MKSAAENKTSFPVVDVNDLIIEFDTPDGRKRVVDQVSFSVHPGEVLGILGESGSGKTMSTQAILGLVDGYPGVMGGTIQLNYQGEHFSLLNGLVDAQYTRRGQVEKRERVWKKSLKRQLQPLWGRAVTAIFQNPRRSLDPLMTVGQQVGESILSRHRNESSKPSPDQVKSETLEWLTRVKMVNPVRVLDSYPHELSGGMCQRAMIAVALACKPSLLIADEPTTGLDATVRAQVVSLLQELINAEQCAMLYITHDIREMLYLADRIIVMRHGRVLERTTPALLRSQEGAQDPYTQMLLEAAGLMGQVEHTIQREEMSHG